MPNGDDQQQECCAAMICCDKDKADKALAAQLREHPDPLDAAEFLHAHYDMLPKAAGLAAVVKYIQAHQYK